MVISPAGREGDNLAARGRGFQPDTANKTAADSGAILSAASRYAREPFPKR